MRNLRDQGSRVWPWDSGQVISLLRALVTPSVEEGSWSHMIVVSIKEMI